MCEEQFKLKKHKNLCQFIGELYKRSLITNLTGFIDDLSNNLNNTTKLKETDFILRVKNT